MKNESEQKFWNLVNKTDNCWEWKGGTDVHGYGIFYFNSKSIKAHRVSYFLTHNTLPEVIHHLCHNKLCVRIDHLRATTHKEHGNIHAPEFKDKQQDPSYKAYVRSKLIEVVHCNQNKDDAYNLIMKNKTVDDDGCWIYCKDASICGKSYKTKRIVWEVMRGEIPPKFVLVHKLPANPNCCNPDHHQIMTPQMQSKMIHSNKSTIAKVAEYGKRASKEMKERWNDPSYRAKLSIPQDKIDKIIELSKNGMSMRGIGREVGVDPATVKKYLNTFLF